MTLHNSDTSRGKRWRPAVYYGGCWLLLTLWLRLCMPETLMGFGLFFPSFA